MRRWIFQTPFGTVRLHNILRADIDRDLHDHPFDFVSIILRGGYSEISKASGFAITGNMEFGAGIPRFLPAKVRTYRPGNTNRKACLDIHRIVEVLPNTWTLVFTGPRLRTWGFHTDQGFVPWREYPSITGSPIS
jgi:hypothetical protein